MACTRRPRFSTEPLLGEHLNGARRRHSASVDQQAFPAKAPQDSAGRAASEPANPNTRRCNARDGFCATTECCDEILRDGNESQSCKRLPDEDDIGSAASSYTDASTSSTSPPTPLVTKEGQPSCSLGSPELPGLNRGTETSNRAAADYPPAAAQGKEAGSSPVDSRDASVETLANTSVRHERGMHLAGWRPPTYTSSCPTWPNAGVTLGFYASVPGNTSAEHLIRPGLERPQADHRVVDYAKVEFEEERDEEDAEHDSGEGTGPNVDPLSSLELQGSLNDLQSLGSEPDHLENAAQGRYEDVLVERLKDLRLHDETGSVQFQTTFYDPESSPSSLLSKSPYVEKSSAWRRSLRRERLNLEDPSLREQLLSWLQASDDESCPRTEGSASYQASTNTPGGILKTTGGRHSDIPWNLIDESDQVNEYDDVWPEEFLRKEPSELPPELLLPQTPSPQLPLRRLQSQEKASDIVLKPVLREGDFLRLGVASGVISRAEEKLCWDLSLPQFESETAESPDTKSKACLRCRFQKQRCLIDEANPEAPCLPCQLFSKTSRKTIHRTPCFRKKIGDVVLHRRGGLDLTKRWQGVELKDIHEQRPKGRTRTIAFTSDICDVPIEVEVMRFTPRRDDVTKRYWTVVWNDKLVRKSKELAPYCLVDIQKTADDFELYIDNNWQQAFLNQSAELPTHNGEKYAMEHEDNAQDDASEDESFNSKSLRSDESVALPSFIEKTHRIAYLHFAQLPDKVKEGDNSNMAPNKEKMMLEALFKLWFANREFNYHRSMPQLKKTGHTRGSSYICSEDTLGMQPEYEEGYPLPGKVSLPRMILAQFDSITYSRGLQVHAGTFIREMETLMARKDKEKPWFTTYISLFVLLSEASWLTRDRYRHARQQYGHAVRYSIPAFVEELQEGCNIMLMHWHYFNYRPQPNTDKPQEEQESFLADLTPLQYNLVVDTIQRPEIQRHLEIFRKEREHNGKVDPLEAPKQTHPSRNYRGPQTAMDWDEPYYWVSQMFEENWRPHRTYMRETVPVRVPTESEDGLESDEEDEVEESGEELGEEADEGAGEEAIQENATEPVKKPSNEPVNEPAPGYIEAAKAAYLEQMRRHMEAGGAKESIGVPEADKVEPRLRDPEIYTTRQVDPNREDDSAELDTEITDISPTSDGPKSTSSSSVSPEKITSDVLRTFPFLQGRSAEELKGLGRSSGEFRRRMKRLRSLKEGDRLTQDDMVLFGDNEM